MAKRNEDHTICPMILTTGTPCLACEYKEDRLQDEREAQIEANRAALDPNDFEDEQDYEDALRGK